MNDRKLFYSDVVHNLIEDKNALILVCGGGILDKDILQSLGFINVVISNLDTRMTGKEYTPFKWKYENAESLSFHDESFDYVITHASIHHASSPHRMLTEMYRVAKRGILAIESRDSIIMRFLERYGVTQTYEHCAVYHNDCQYGGVNNTEIPNFIYRWTEREIEKTIQSYSPCYKHTFVYRYGTGIPHTHEYENKATIKTFFLNLMRPLFWLFSKVFPKQQNLFAFYVEKPISTLLFPWLIIDDKEHMIRFSKKWGDLKYKS